jgi:cell wall-associated NlpC family hydrolase
MKRQLVLLLIAVPAIAGVFVLAGSAGAQSVDSKRAQARAAMAQIEQMDRQLEEVGNKWQGAKLQLDQTTTRLNSTRRSLRIARKSLGLARHALAQRVIAVYMEQGNETDSTVAILFQATSLQDMINSVEAAQRISDHDARVVKQVKNVGDRVAVQEKALTKMQTRQEALLAQVTAEKSSLEGKIRERQAYVRSKRREIASLLAAQERERQRLAAQASARVSSWNGSPPPAPQSNVPPSSVGAAAVQQAMTRLGAPYVWGASGPSSFDCSGLVVWAYGQVGRSLPHYSYSLMHSGTPVSYSQLEPGDLVFFYGGGHVGIYVGGGQFIHAPHTGTVVQVNSLGGYGGGLTAAVRIS